MKRITIEEKAYDGNYKAFTELTNRLEDVKNAIKKQNYGIAMDILCKPYTEFQITKSTELKESKESDDERIKKAIKYGLDYVFTNNTTIYETTKEQCLYWLEKQGKNNMGISEATKQKLEDNLNKALEKETPESYNEFLEKQGEQKPAKFDDTNAKLMFIKALERVDEQNAKGYKLTDCDKNSWWEDFKAYCSEQNLVNSAKTCKDEQDAAWSEEDENMIEAIEALCDDKIRFTEFKDIEEYAYKIKNWLKSLKDRVQPNQEWSEEDKKLWVHDDDIFLDAAKMIVEDSPRKSYGGVHKKEIVPWFYLLKERLKSLRPQSQWKPSKEHYELEEFAKIVRGNLTGISKAVQELFEAKYLQLTGNKMYGGFKD